MNDAPKFIVGPAKTRTGAAAQVSIVEGEHVYGWSRDYADGWGAAAWKARAQTNILPNNPAHPAYVAPTPEDKAPGVLPDGGEERDLRIIAEKMAALFALGQWAYDKPSTYVESAYGQRDRAITEILDFLRARLSAPQLVPLDEVAMGEIIQSTVDPIYQRGLAREPLVSGTIALASHECARAICARFGTPAPTDDSARVAELELELERELAEAKNHLVQAHRQIDRLKRSLSDVREVVTDVSTEGRAS